jgi:hypothetical protein
MKIVTEWMVTVKGFGRVSTDRITADSQEQAEAKAMERLGVSVHSAPFSEKEIDSKLMTKAQLVAHAVRLHANPQWANAVTKAKLVAFIDKHEEKVS